MSFPHYPKYKPSGVEWLGEVPTHWMVSRIGRLTRNGMGQTILRDMLEMEPSAETLPVYSASEGDDVFGHFANPAVRLSSGDLIVGARGSIGMTRRVIAPATCTQTAIWIKPSDKSVDSTFLYWCLVAGRDGLFPFDKTAVPMLTVERVRSGGIPVPSLPEQMHIAKFLDRETAKIDGLVKEQRRLMELLQEKRQAVISHAVTRGLNPQAPLKSSGIEWLGDIPAHWTVAHLNRLVQPGRRITYGIVQPGERDENGRYMVRGQDYSFGWAAPEALFKVSDAVEIPYKRARLKAGDLVITIVGAGVGNIAVVPEWLDGANLTQTTARIAVNAAKADACFVAAVLKSAIGKRCVEFYAKGAAQPGLNIEHVRVFLITLPPLDEQRAIAQFIEDKTSQFDTLTAEAQRAIDLLQERRTALISAAVTGQIDVRNT